MYTIEKTGKVKITDSNTKMKKEQVEEIKKHWLSNPWRNIIIALNGKEIVDIINAGYNKFDNDDIVLAILQHPQKGMIIEKIIELGIKIKISDDVAKKIADIANDSDLKFVIAYAKLPSADFNKIYNAELRAGGTLSEAVKGNVEISACINTNVLADILK